MLRVVHVIATTSRRGAEVFAVDLVESLEVLGISGRLVAIQATQGQIEVPSLSGRWPSAIAILRLRREFRDADVVVAHGSSALPAVALASLGRRTPFVYRMIGDPSFWARRRLARWRIGWALRRAERVVVLWEAAGRYVTKQYRVDPAHLAVIPTGVDAERFVPASESQRERTRDRLGMTSGPVGIIVGSLTQEKNVAAALRAAAAVPDLALMVVGEGQQRGELEELALRLAPSRVWFCGAVDDVRPLLESADVLIMASHTEGVPAVLLEAAMCGVPVVATRVGAIPEVVLDGCTGTLVDAGDDAGLRAAIIATLERGRDGVRSSRPLIVDRFGMELVADRWRDVLKDAVRQTRSSPPVVLHVIKGLGPGGAEKLLVALARTADQSTFQHRVLYLLRSKSELVPELEAQGVSVRCLEARSARDFRWILRLRRHLRDVGADVVHVHSPLIASMLRLLARTIRPNPSTMATEHNLWPAYGRTTRVLNAMTFGLDDHHLAVSEEARASVWRRHRGNVETLIHGVASDEVRSARGSRERVRLEFGLEDDQVAVVVVANYRVHKDYPTMLAAARLVADTDPTVRFLVVGQGPLAGDIERERARLGLEDTVSLLGYRADALEVMAAADVFALSSIQEGLPVALMEALVLGLPVVATSVGGIPSAVTDQVEGLLVPPRRPDLLAAALIRLVNDDEERARFARAAAARGDLFDAERSTRRLEAIYAGLVSGHGSQKLDVPQVEPPLVEGRHLTRREPSPGEDRPLSR